MCLLFLKGASDAVFFVAGKGACRLGAGKGEKICRSVHQYSKGKIPDEDMEKLTGIAHDCMLVRNYVYRKYGGIGGLEKIYPGYAVDTEMAACGLREKLNLPSVYYSRAVFDALGDIKTQWTQVKNGIYAAMNGNERFSPEDRHYLRFVIKAGGCFEAILNGRKAEAPKEMQAKYAEVLEDAGHGSMEHIQSLDRYLRRQVRKRLRKLHTEKEDVFSVKARGYRYGECGGEHGIFLTTREKGKRLFLPLTDKSVYDRVLTLKLNPGQGSVEIVIPLFTEAKVHKDYMGETGVSIGLWDMATTDKGHVYGTEFGRKQKELSDFILASADAYRRERGNNPGRKKATARRKRLESSLKTYVNMELNRLLLQEKPGILYLPKLPVSPTTGKGKSGDTFFLRAWKKGYVEERLRFKCRQNSIRIVEVMGKGIGTECSICGAQGRQEGGQFRCGSCGYEAGRKVNSARNALNRGRKGQIINEVYPAEKGEA